jgi:hypothetical protein
VLNAKSFPQKKEKEKPKHEQKYIKKDKLGKYGYFFMFHSSMENMKCTKPEDRNRNKAYVFMALCIHAYKVGSYS